MRCVEVVVMKKIDTTARAHQQARSDTKTLTTRSASGTGRPSAGSAISRAAHRSERSRHAAAVASCRPSTSCCRRQGHKTHWRVKRAVPGTPAAAAEGRGKRPVETRLDGGQLLACRFKLCLQMCNLPLLGRQMVASQAPERLIGVGHGAPGAWRQASGRVVRDGSGGCGGGGAAAGPPPGAAADN